MSDLITPKLRVLVVDDEAKYLRLAKINLSARGFEVEVTQAGEEAMKKINDNQPHIVLLDVMMPRLTGDELVKMITDWKPEIRVIMVTANISQEAEEECRRNGAYAYIKKPVDFDKLAEIIRQAAT
jgi:DNA-binding NtrC family response regulator